MNKQQQETEATVLETFKLLWPYISIYKAGLVVAIIALIVNALGDAVLISMIKPLMDESFGGLGSIETDFLAMMPWFVLGLMIVRSLSSFVSTYCLAWVSGNVVMNIRRKMFNHFMAMPVSFFDKESSGSLLSRITYDSEQVANATSSALINIVRECTTIVSLVALMFWNSWQLSAILIIIAPVVAIGIKMISARFRKVSRGMQDAMGSVTAQTEQMLKGHKVVLNFGGQEKEKARFEDVSNQMRQQSMKLTAANAISTPAIQMVASLALVFVLFLAGSESLRSELTPGTFAVVFGSMFGLMRPIRGLTNVNSQFQRGMAACGTLFALLDLETEKDNGKHEVERVSGAVKVNDVTFTYPTKETPALRNVSFDLEAGKTLALVGRSGSGKSTIANLLTRFYDIDSGSISIDGHEVKDYTLKNLREQVAVVSQNVHLFNDTLANNIAYACGDKYSRAEIEKAAELASAMDFIRDLDDGLDTVIGENGVSLSGGQRQRIAIARALLRNAPILILDEATSALDTESERAIQSALDELQKDRTVLVIAHRLSTIENADQILVVDEGEVIERGSHSELIAKEDGSYAQLHRIQFGQ
ncbi:lipid A ABC transporter ATP-binding protein/permease MsbA [Photobacterium swingsii]|uniref:Lipid A ABC transporter ATP-binding protein/permease MsbA n=1 Tax=Photobacterium swingsii TaxID=680026 RepID=A0A0J8VG02_9GAMM|nr:lipid A ABC transporter ATP-binding protein/permease MsbA [Photobacterium swingsii]KMV32156.1 lipid transporter ATP-binding/permease [Photobacterium swingsii]PSW26944.1 lipid A ABC transporter ATP-binding protein/permease MsbA [Photobacterium swingsii]